MKRGLLIIALAIGFIGAKAQDIVYDPNAEVRKVDKFNGIDVSGTVALYLSQGNETAVAISAGEEKYNNKIKTEVKNGVLHISVDGGMWNGFSWTNKKLKAYVSVPDISTLHVSGASYVVISGKLTTESLALQVSGASELKGALEVKNLNMGISGASVVRLTGTAESANVEASGAVRMNGYDLKVDNARFDISGASHITIWVNKELSANASGGSTIQYKGDAVAKSMNANGGATIQRKSL
jgi:hypothetical protein